MLRIDQSHPFTACWNENNAQLNPNRGGFLENTIRKVVKIIFYIPNCLMPFKASLASQCSAEQLICLDPSETGPSTHFSALNAQNTAEGTSAVTIIADFLSE